MNQAITKLYLKLFTNDVYFLLVDNYLQVSWDFCYEQPMN